jgi:hypothetical protein
VPGLGESLRLVLRDEIHDIQRCPRVQECVSYCRLVKCAKESAGKRYGTAGTTIGHAYLTWAFSEAAVLCLRNTPPGQKLLVRLEKTQGKGQAWTGLAHKLARAVYQMLTRERAWDRQHFLQRAYGADEPGAELADPGRSLERVRCRAHSTASRTLRSPEAVAPEPCPLIGHPLRLCSIERKSCQVDVGRPSPEPHGRTAPVQPPL